MKKSSTVKKDNKVINIVIVIGIIFLIASLILMFVNGDGKNNNLKNISYSEYLELAKKDEYSIIILTNPTCIHCNNYKPFVNYVATENNLNAYNLDLTTITYDEYTELHDRYNAIKDDYSDGEPVIRTPATIIVRNDKEVTSVLGDIGYNGLVKLLKNNQIIK